METQKKYGIVALVSSVAVVLVALMSPSSHAWFIDPFDLAMGYKDAMTNSLSIRLTSADYTTYLHSQLNLQTGKTFDPWSHTRFSEMPLCGNDRAEWLALRCKVWKAVYSPPYCGKNGHCVAFQIAELIHSDEMLRNAMMAAIAHPSKFLFGPDKYAATYGIGGLHAPGLALSPPAAKDIARELARRRPGKLKEVDGGTFVLTF